MTMMTLWFLLLYKTTILLSVTHTVWTACFGGIVTFEKSTGFSSNGTTGPRLATNTQSVLDCLNACTGMESCKAFKIDYSTGDCYSYTTDSFAEGRTDTLTPTQGVNYFEKTCLMVNATYLRTMCADKKWAFQRVKNGFLEVPPDKTIRTSSRAECARLCFIENEFTCRAANFDQVTSQCQLLGEDRRTQAAAFRLRTNSNWNYLENQCSVRIIESCQYEAIPNIKIAHPDHELFAASQRACIAECNSASKFFCRSYSYNPTSKSCQLSGDDKASMSDTRGNVLFVQGIISGQRDCILVRCSGSSVTYERITGRHISAAKQDVLAIEGQRFSSLACLRACTNSDSFCRALHVDYQSERCYKLDRNTQSTGTTLLPREGTSYFEQICLPSASRHCPSKAWSFERLQGFEMVPSPEDRLLTTIQNRLDCEEACLKALETGFVCRSAVYDGLTTECRLSRQCRRTKPKLLREARSPSAEYLENQCVPPPARCEFIRIPDVLPRYPDLTVLRVQSEDECKRACAAVTNFTCRGAGFRLSAAECRLSGDDKDGKTVPHKGAVYFDRSCDRDSNNINDQLNGGDNDNNGHGHDNFPTVPPVNTGRCGQSNIGVQQNYERTTGYYLPGGSLIHSSFGAGIIKECKRACDGIPTCQGFSVDYMTSRCYSTKEVNPIFTRRALAKQHSQSYFEAVCVTPIPECNRHWSFERTLNKALEGFDKFTYRRISKAECREKCLQERRFQCRSVTYTQEECQLSDEDRLSQPQAFVDSPGSDYIENQCATPSWKSNVVINRDGSRPTRQQKECDVKVRVEGSTLNYNDESIDVPNEVECRRACQQQQSFVCRSISFINQGAGTMTCYLSAETRDSPGGRLEPVPGSVYEELDCTRTGSPVTRPPDVSPSPGTTCDSPEDYTFERVMGMMPKGKPSSEIRVTSTESPTEDCLKECLKVGDQCLGVAVHYSGGAPYDSPCSAYDKVVTLDPRSMTARADTAYFAKVCIKERKCNESLWAVETVPGFALIGFDFRRLQNIMTKEECMSKCFQETNCRSVEFFPRARTCHLSSETRRSQPFAFRMQREDVQYMENQCTQDPSSCNFVDFPNVFLPYADRTISSITTLSACKQECSQENNFMCRSVSFDNRANTCSLSACDKRCNPTAQSILIQKAQSTYSERSSCTPPPRPFPPYPPFRPMFPMRPPPPPRPPMLPLPFPPPPPPFSVLGRNTNRRQDQEEFRPGCVPLYLRANGIGPTNAQNGATLNTTGPIGTTKNCVTACDQWKEKCVAFVLQSGDPPCLAYDTPVVDLEQRPGVVYFRKACFIGRPCSKLWAFDVMMGYQLQGFDTRKILNVGSEVDCAELCFEDSTIICRSAEYIAVDRICHLSVENRNTQPDKFHQVEGNSVIYLQNNCVVK